MEKNRVIALRNKLKAGNNWPLIVYIDNTFRLIDESNTLQFTKWDDENGFLYVYALSDPIKDNSFSNISGGVSLFATDYEHIQAMEVFRMGIDHLPISIDSLGCIASEWKERIIERFKIALNPDIAELSAKDINRAMGTVDGQKAIRDDIDYYNGKYYQPFKETRPMAKHNEYAEKVAADKAATAVEETISNEDAVEESGDAEE